MTTAILFDYGATLDTGGTHWYHIFARQLLAACPTLSDAAMREAYVYAERTVAQSHGIADSDDFLCTLRAKVALQCQYLEAHGLCPAGTLHAETAAQACYATARSHTQQAAHTLQQLQAAGYTLGLVSNFYGNLHAVLADFALLPYFSSVTESATEHLYKPDPRLWQTALTRLHVPAAHALAVGDSYPKDIVPAHAIGCHTAWLRGQGWNPPPAQTPAADHILSSLAELPRLLHLQPLPQPVEQ